MSQFHLDQLFPLILLPCNTLSTLPLHTVEAMLTCVHSHLQPGGIFAASIPNPALLLRLARQAEAEIEDIFPHPEDHEPVQVSSAWVRDESIFKVSWIYDHLLPDGRVDRLEMSTQHHLYPAGYYLEKFSAAGFHLIQQFGDFNLASYRKDSPSLIFITQRAS